MSGIPQYPPQPQAPTQPPSPTQLGVRPAPALVQQLLIGAFGWMFAGLLLTAGVAFLVSGSTQLIETVGHYWFLEISPWDPRIFLATASLLTITALVATWLPARRASRMEPRIAMQQGECP